MRLREEHYEELVDHAKEDWPNECVGIIGVDRSGESQHLLKLENVSQFPGGLYLGDPNAVYSALFELEERNLELGFIYHSHPHSAPVPSAIDVDNAWFPDAIYLIAGFVGAGWRDERRMSVRGWWIVGGDSNEAIDWTPLDPEVPVLSR